MPDRRPGLVKLAKVFQPSLQLLVMHLTKKYRIDDHQWRPEWNVSDLFAIRGGQMTDSHQYFPYCVWNAGIALYGYFPAVPVRKFPAFQ